MRRYLFIAIVAAAMTLGASVPPAPGPRKPARSESGRSVITTACCFLKDVQLRWACYDPTGAFPSNPACAALYGLTAQLCEGVVCSSL